MGRIGKIISYFLSSNFSQNKINLGAGEIITGNMVSPGGDDSPPLQSDFCVVIFTEGTGNGTAIGYSNPLNLNTASPGEKRIYARNADGNQSIELYLKNNGSLTISNGNGLIEMQAGGDIVLNGVLINTSGDVTIPSSLLVNGKEIAEHVHSAGIPPGNTGINI